MTKVHEEVVRGTASELAARYASVRPKGEITVVIAPTKNAGEREIGEREPASERSRPRRDPSRLAPEIRARREERTHPARPRAVLLRALSSRLRVRDGHPRP